MKTKEQIIEEYEEQLKTSKRESMIWTSSIVSTMFLVMLTLIGIFDKGRTANYYLFWMPCGFILFTVWFNLYMYYRRKKK